MFKNLFSSESGNRKYMITGIIAVVVAVVAVTIIVVLSLNQADNRLNRKAYVLSSSLRGYLTEQGEAEKVIDVRVGEPGELRYGGTSYFMKSVIQEVPGRLNWPVAIPEGQSRLEFSVAFLCPEEYIPGPVDVAVTIETDGETRELFATRFWVRYTERRFVYYDERISLSDFAGRDANIVFRSEAASDSVRDVEIVWGNPSIFVEQDTRLPNVVLICLDTLRADRSGFLNPDSELTPELNKLAEDSVVFRHAISQSPWTLPSVATVLTGLYPSLHRAGKRITLESEMAHDELAPEMQDQGMIIGRSRYLLSRLPELVPTIPEILGDRYDCHMVNGNGILCASTDIVSRFPTYTDSSWHGRTVAGKSGEWLTANADKLFFLYAHYMEPHEWWKHYKELYPEDEDFDPGKSGAIYDDFVRMGDLYIGQLIDHLKKLDLYDSSLIVFYSDHGEHLMDKGWEKNRGHGGTMSNILLEIPLLVKFPYSEHAGESVDSYVKLMDVFKTILEEAGVDKPETLYDDGVSLRRFVEGGEVNPQRYSFSEYMLKGREQIALQAGEYRLIYFYDEDRYRFVNAGTDKRIVFKNQPEARPIADQFEEMIRSYLEMIKNRKELIEQARFSDEEKDGIRNLGYIK